MSNEEKSPVERLTPYNGSEDYIFISYSHRDKDAVFPILERMKEEGYRFWYDEGIDPGSEWPESIADHLGRCRVCLAFMSPNSLASQNCRREINFALSREKEFLSVILTPVEMTPGVEMQISTYQSILKYKYKTDDMFFERLIGLTMLEGCREKQAEQPAAEQVPTEKTLPTHRINPDANVKSPTPEAARKRKLIIIAASATLAAILIAAAVIAAVTLGRKDGGTGTGASENVTSAEGSVSEGKGDTSSPSTDGSSSSPAATDAPETDVPDKNEEIVLTDADFVIGGEKINDGDDSISVRDAEITVRNTAAIATLRNIKYISFTNCTFETGALDKLSTMKQLTSLSFEECRGIDDLDFCSGLDKLWNFKANMCGLDDSDIAAIAKLPIKQLYLNGNELTSVPKMENDANINVLEIANNKIGSVEALSEWTSLRTLDISSCGLTSLSGLEALIDLRNLNASGNVVSDITPLSNMVYLSNLFLKDCGIDSLSPLQYCEQLKYVSLEGNPGISDLSVLAKSIGTLEQLNINGLEKITSLDFLAGSTNLTTLSADDCGITDCSAISGNKALTHASLRGNEITDISAFSGMHELRRLFLQNNRIASIPDLDGVGSSESTFSILLSNNQLSNLNGIETAGYYIIAVDGNPLTDISALSKTKCTYFAFDCTENLSLDPLYQSGVSTLYVTSLFVGKRLELESLGKGIRYVTPEEFMDIFSF